MMGVGRRPLLGKIWDRDSQTRGTIGSFRQGGGRPEPFGRPICCSQNRLRFAGGRMQQNFVRNQRRGGCARARRVFAGIREGWPSNSRSIGSCRSPKRPRQFGCSKEPPLNGKNRPENLTPTGRAATIRDMTDHVPHQEFPTQPAVSDFKGGVRCRCPALGKPSA